MKRLKRWLLGLLSGELLHMRRKDDTLKNKVADAQGITKAKVIAESLIDFNSSFLQSFSLKELPTIIKKHYESIEQEIQHFVKEYTTLTPERIDKYCDILIQRITTLKSDLVERAGDVNTQYALQEKLDQFIQKIEDIQHPPKKE